MRFITLVAIRKIHSRAVRDSGGSDGLRDLGALKSALAQPSMTFGGSDLYPTLIDKAAAMGFSLIKNHPFVDGNKRAGHAAIEMMLRLNGHKISAPVEEQEKVILALAAGQMAREPFTEWLRAHVIKHASP